jgi:hypothetical protein
LGVNSVQPPPLTVRTTMAAAAARHVAPGALRAAKAASALSSEAPGGVHFSVGSARAPRARSSPARGRTALRLAPGGASRGVVFCSTREPSERAAMPALRALRAARRNLPLRAAAAADGADLSSPTISVRVRLSGAGEKPAGDLVLRNVDPHASTPRALVARWAAELAISAEPCTAVARADRAGAEEVPLHDLDVTLSAAGVTDGGVVLVELAGFKLITLRLSADKECLVTLHGALGMANMLRGYNAVALRKVVDAASPSQDSVVLEFESLESGAAYAPVPRAPPPAPPAVRNVTLLRELLPPDASGSVLPPLVFDSLTKSDLDSVLHELRATGVSTTRLPPHLLLRDVAKLTDGASYYVVPRASGGMGEIDTLKQQARGALGAKGQTLAAW